MRGAGSVSRRTGRRPLVPAFGRAEPDRQTPVATAAGRYGVRRELTDISFSQTEDLEDAFFELYSQVKGGGEDA